MREGEAQKIRLGVSACPLGRQVRYDGGHKRDPFLTDTLGPLVEWIPVCSEVEIGLGVPRDTIRLVGEAAAAPRLVVDKTGEDLTACMQRYARSRVRELVPLVVPLTLIKHHVRWLSVAYLADQTYLAPHPKELMLRNHV